MSLVVDASAATAACLAADGFALLPAGTCAPFLLRSEVLSAIQGLEWRRQISRRLADLAADRLLESPVQLVRRVEIHRRARQLARRLGWAKTYDAEYLALALDLGAPLLTVDRRLARRAREVVEVLTPADLG